MMRKKLFFMQFAGFFNSMRKHENFSASKSIWQLHVAGTENQTKTLNRAFSKFCSSKRKCEGTTMAKGKMNSKAAEKKKERIALQRKMDARIAIVREANAQPDPLSGLPSFKVNFGVNRIVEVSLGATLYFRPSTEMGLKPR